jgi:uncharacterized protein (DUF488 family)
MTESKYYMIGYGGYIYKREDFIRKLQGRSVRTLIDVRDSPNGWAPYNQVPLEKILKENDIEYVHIPELGVPEEYRNSLSKPELWKWYDSNRLPRVESLVENTIKSYLGNYAFMCAEKDPLGCHRHRIAKALADKGITCEEV